MIDGTDRMGKKNYGKGKGGIDGLVKANGKLHLASVLICVALELGKDMRAG